MPVLVLLFAFIFLIIFMFSFLLRRYKRVPANKVLVIYGKTETGDTICRTSGAHFVWPVIQDYAYLDMAPIQIELNLKGVRNRNKESINVLSKITVAISDEEDLLMQAAKRLLGKTTFEINNLALDIARDQFKKDIASMDIENFDNEWEATSGFIEFNINKALNKVGLTLINMNISDIQRNVRNTTQQN